MPRSATGLRTGGSEIELRRPRTGRSSAHLHVFHDCDSGDDDYAHLPQFRDHDRGDNDDDGADDDAKLHTSGFKPPMAMNRWCGVDVADGTIT